MPSWAKEAAASQPSPAQAGCLTNTTGPKGPRAMNHHRRVTLSQALMRPAHSAAASTGDPSAGTLPASAHTGSSQRHARQWPKIDKPSSWTVSSSFWLERQVTPVVIDCPVMYPLAGGPYTPCKPAPSIDVHIMGDVQGGCMRPGSDAIYA